MRIIRFHDSTGQIHHGVSQPDGRTSVIEGDLFSGYAVTGRTVRVEKLLAPVAPAQIWCIGLNYRKHAEETNSALPDYPVLFMKGINAVQHPGDPILLPTHLASAKVDYECELAVVIGRAGKNIPREQAVDHILGYTCANDVSARDWQKHGGGGQWCRGKTFDTFCPLGPCLVTPDEIPNPNRLRLRTEIGGTTCQDSNTADMIFDVPAIIEFLSGSTTLLPGTVILTGTPEGVGMGRTPPRWLQPGETVSVTIDGIGTLSNPVARE